MIAPDRAAVGDGQDGVGRVVRHAVGGRLDAIEEAAEAFPAGEGEVELEGRPAIHQRRLCNIQILEAATSPSGRSRSRASRVDLDLQVAGNGRGRLPAAPQGAAKAAPAGPAGGCTGPGRGPVAGRMSPGADRSRRPGGRRAPRPTARAVPG